MLKSYNGNLLELGLGEQFLLHLSDVPDYRALISGHLTRAEFTADIQRLKTTLKASVAVCKLVLDSSQLREILQLILKIGNFLNHVSKFVINSFTKNMNSWLASCKYTYFQWLILNLVCKSKSNQEQKYNHHTTEMELHNMKKHVCEKPLFTGDWLFKSNNHQVTAK